MTFRRFASNNVIRNKRTYAAFFFSSVFSVMIFFMYAMFIYHPGIENGARSGAIHWSAAKGLAAAEYIIYVFACFFLFYSVSAFLKKREKEFGILFIHGMSRWQRNKLLILENLLIGALAIGCGLALGMVFSKLFFLFAAYLLGTEPLPFYLPWEAIALTVAAFAILFFAITLFTLLFLGKTKVIELLNGQKKPKKEPKASLLLSLLAIVLLGIGYTLALLAEGAMVPFFLLPVSLIVIAGSYFLFTQVSVYTIRLLKRNRPLYWHHTNLITLSDLAYRMKDNARMFFLVCIVSTVAFCAVGSLASYADSIRQKMERLYPFAFSYLSLAEHPQQSRHQAMIEQALAKQGVAYQKHMTLLRVPPAPADTDQVMLMKQSAYNRLAQAIGAPPLALAADQAAELSRSTTGPKQESISVEGHRLTVVGAMPNMLASTGTPWRVYVVDDALYASSTADASYTAVTFAVDDWLETFEVATHLQEAIGSSSGGEYQFTARVLPYHDEKLLANMMLFVGLFVGILFFVASGSFLYFRLYTDLESDKRQYRAITKIGLTERELSRIVTTQIGLLFFVPIAVALIHSSIAFVSLQNMLKLLHVTSIVKPTAIVLASFLLVQIVYFLLIRTRYLYHLKQAIR